MTDTALQHTAFQGTDEYIEALDTLCLRARNSLVFFENDFDGIGFNSEARYNALRSFLLGHPNARLQLLAHSPAYLERNCPRMLILLRQFSHKMSIHQTPQHLRNLTEPFAVADELHYVRRFHFDDPRGILALYDPEGARQLRSQFNDIWTASRPAVSANTTGL